jgi:1,4-alpha-glucan branching enzyme
MIRYNDDGSVHFSICLPQADAVDLVGAFEGWHERHYPMQRDDRGRWSIVLDIGPGTYLFRYLANATDWHLDDAAHGEILTSGGDRKSRVYRPPLRLEPDGLAA